jgi:hypothetical protein
LRGCAAVDAKAVLRNVVAASHAGSTAGDERGRNNGHCTPMPDGMTEHCHFLPCRPLAGSSLAISKRDPAASFNCNIILMEANSRGRMAACGLSSAL